MPREYPRNDKPEIPVVLSLVSLLGIFYYAARTVTSIEDKVAFLNILIQVSSVMVGFTSLISVFLIQSSLQNGRDVASRYLHLFLEIKKLEHGNTKPARGANHSADTSLINKMKNLMGSYKREQDQQRRVLK